MAEERIECFTFTVKKDVYDHAVTLSGERKIGNVKVFLTKEMMKYAKRISKTREHANEPLPRKLNSQTNENVKVSLMLTRDEYENAKKVMKYHWFYQNGKYQASRFMSCLIENAWYKSHPEGSNNFDPKMEKEPSYDEFMDLTGDYDDEDWSGEG